MNTKTNSKRKILLLALTLVMVLGMLVAIPITSSAATNRAGSYYLYGTYNIGDGNKSGYLNEFKIQVSTQYFTDDSGTNGTTKYQDATFPWTYFSFYIYATDIDEHVSFKLTRNGSTYTSKSLSGDGNGYLYQGSLSDGDYVLTYVGTYWSGIFSKKTYTFTYRFTVDTTAPSVSLKAGGSTISSGSYTNKAITFTASDSYSTNRVYYMSPSASSYTWTTGSKSVSATSSNNGWWYFYGSDTYQSTSTYKVYLDTVAPVGKITNSSGTTLASGSYTNKPVKYTATDTGGINYLQVQTPGSSSWSTYSSGTALSSATGWYYFRAVDKAGNISSTSSVYYDATAPSGTLYGGTTSKSSGSYTNASYIKYVPSDSHSGIANIYVRKPGSSSYVAYTSGTQLTAEGTYYFYCTDKSGNSSSTVNITLDKTVPTGTLYGGTTTKSSGSYTNASYVKYTASDSLSGVNAIYVKMPGSSYYTSYSSGTQLATEGTYYFYCVDKAGNQSSTVSITLDNTKPKGTLYAGSSSTTSGSRTNASSVKFTATDAIGLSTIYVKKPGATGYTSYTSGTALTAEGTYSFYATDLAGNQSDTYTITVDRQTPNAQLWADDNMVSSGTYTNAEYVSFQCDETCYVKMPGATSFVSYVSGTEFNKIGKYVFYGVDAAGNSTGEYTVIIDRTSKQVNISNVMSGSTNGDVVISWTNGDANSFAPIKSVTVNGKAISNGATIHTIDTGKYIVKVVDMAGNEWQTEFVSTKKNVLTDTLVKEYFEATDINGDPFAFTTYEKALEFATARENSKVKTAEWNNSTWDTGIPMDTVDAANAKNGTYFIYYKSGNPDELVAYFTVERLDEVIAEYAKDGIIDYYYWEKTPATAGPGENLHSYSANRNILANEIIIGENVGVTVDGETFVGGVYNTEGKHVMAISDSYGNTCEYNITVIRTLPELFYAIGEGEAVKVDLERTYYFKDEISISITDALDEMAMFNVYDENGELVGSFSLGEICKLSESGSYTAVAVNHIGETEAFKIVISRNAPSVDLKADEAEKQLVITVTESEDKESHFQTLEIYKSTDGGSTWEPLVADDYGTAVELNNLVYKFRTSGMYKIVITDEFRTGMDSITGQITYTQPAPTGDLAGVENGGHTNKEVTFTWEDEAKVTVTKDGEEIEYKSGDKLTADGSYTIVFENFDGAKSTYEFIIDTEAPEVAAQGHKADLPVNTPVSVDILDEEATAVLIKNGEEVGEYVSGTPISDEGKYVIRVTDKAENVTEIAFEIDKSVDFAINVNDGGLSNSVTIEANEGAEIVVTKDGNVIDYKEGSEITEPGKYTVKVTDALDNVSERSFIIVTPVSTGFSHSFDETVGFEKVIINGEETRLNYGALELTEDGTYEVEVIVNGKTYTFTTTVDKSVSYDINVHDKGFANTVTLKANENFTLTMSKNGEPMEYKLGTEITEPAVYAVKMVDSLGNVKELSFTIVDALYGKFEEEIDEMPGFGKVLVNGEEVALEKGTLTLTASGTYEVTIVANGKEQKFTVNVDATAPTLKIEGVENGGSTKGAVIISDVSSDATMKVYLDDVQIEYTAGDELTEVGKYRIVLEDGVGNVSEYSFEILWKMPAAAIVLIVVAVLGAAGAVVWLVISKKRKDEYYN